MKIYKNLIQLHIIGWDGNSIAEEEDIWIEDEVGTIEYSAEYKKAVMEAVREHTKYWNLSIQVTRTFEFKTAEKLEFVTCDFETGDVISRQTF